MEIIKQILLFTLRNSSNFNELEIKDNVVKEILNVLKDNA